MSSNNKTIGLALTVVGLIVAIVGAVAKFWDSITLDDTYAYVIIAVGVVVLVIGILFMYVFDGTSGTAVKKEKKEKAPVAKKAAAPKASGKSRAASVNLGDSELAKAIKYGAEKIDEKVAAGKITDAEGDAYMARIMAYAGKVGKDEDNALVNVSQILGAVAKA